jgi:hypothetical protein
VEVVVVAAIVVLEAAVEFDATVLEVLDDPGCDVVAPVPPPHAAIATAIPTNAAKRM